jgi:hypothetical protein
MIFGGAEHRLWQGIGCHAWIIFTSPCFYFLLRVGVIFT